jgi:hypothetical protein
MIFDNTMARKPDFAPPRLTKKNTKIAIFRKEKQGVQIVSFATTPKQNPLFWLPRGVSKRPFFWMPKKVLRESSKNAPFDQNRNSITRNPCFSSPDWSFAGRSLPPCN